MANILPTTMEYFDKLLGEQLLEGEGGGGSSWQTVFEGSVTTEASGGQNSGIIDYNTQISADVIKVTFNGVEYECNKMTMGNTNGYGEVGQQGPDFTNYPFFINSSTDGTLNVTTVYTESTGTYTLKIEEEQSGESSDFSTAEVSISAAVPGVQCSVVSPHIITTPFDMLVADPKNYSNGDIVTVALYKGKASISASVAGGMGSITVSGDIESMGGGYYLVSGDCTITIS